MIAPYPPKNVGTSRGPLPDAVWVARNGFGAVARRCGALPPVTLGNSALAHFSFA